MAILPASNLAEDSYTVLYCTCEREGALLISPEMWGYPWQRVEDKLPSLYLIPEKRQEGFMWR